jgi:hypothetical protein
MRPCDRAFVFASWKAGYRDSPDMGWVSQAAAQHRAVVEEAYDGWMQLRIERLLARSQVLVARPPDWPEGIMGWVCGEQTPSAFLLHWAHVRKRHRARYTGRSLLWGLVPMLEPRGLLRFTHLRPPFTDALTRNGYLFAPGRADAEESYP